MLGLQSCQYDKCKVPGLAVMAAHLFTCGCGCGKTMHKSCVVEHNKQITHMIQTHRMVSRWK